MKRGLHVWLGNAAAVALLLVGAIPTVAAGQEETAAQAGEKVGIQGQFVRLAENGEGWVVLGYRMANDSVGEDWMLLEVGMTIVQGAKPQSITRDKIKLVTPEGQDIPLPSQQEYAKARADLASLVTRASMIRDSINYFPPGVDRPCRIGFFSDPTRPLQDIAYNQVDLDSQMACVGRLFFHIPGGIKLGNYNLDVTFANSVVRVPMEIMTKEQAKEFEKQWRKAEEEAKKEKHE